MRILLLAITYTLLVALIVAIAMAGIDLNQLPFWEMTIAFVVGILTLWLVIEIVDVNSRIAQIQKAQQKNQNLQNRIALVTLKENSLRDAECISREIYESAIRLELPPKEREVVERNRIKERQKYEKGIKEVEQEISLIQEEMKRNDRTSN